ncbi:O-methyltransferase [Actinoplanes auranticolor]|uniref:O-methyltransferase n=1 Tax=Actinoplanes auranticolor TaxID=47988 RepID=A0A919SU99_9ACTN|nr:class I SAM-dependent methyltransferase [Actinoplanes auranticolor]GIM79050.1 O-methyltransferase [Actinoplanes auranticolor]
MSGAGPVDVKHLPVTPALARYLACSSTAPDPVTASLIARTAATGDAAGMMVQAEQATLLTMLARLGAARSVLDIGTFTGLSALAFARGLAPGGRVMTCDNDDRWHAVAAQHWQRAGVADRIDFRLGPAAKTLRALPANFRADIVFVDADKMNYPGYVELALPLLRPGGLLLLDNVLLDGYVASPELADDPLMRRCAQTMAALNARLAADDRLDVVMLPIADGLTLARRR